MIDGLRRRGVRILQEDVRRLHAVIRAEGRLADLLGYEEAVQTLTNGAAVVWSWLLRYEVSRPSVTAPKGRPRNAWFDKLAGRSEERTMPRPLFGVLLDLNNDWS